MFLLNESQAFSLLLKWATLAKISTIRFGIDIKNGKAWKLTNLPK